MAIVIVSYTSTVYIRHRNYTEVRTPINENQASHIFSLQEFVLKTMHDSGRVKVSSIATLFISFEMIQRIA